MTHYSRLLSGKFHAVFDDNALMGLAGTMESTGLDGRINESIASGAVYFGQFIDHDLTRDDTRLCDAGKEEPEEMINHRTPKLDLESIYGRGPAAELADESIPPVFYLYDHSEKGAELFRLGTAEANGARRDGELRYGSDLPRFRGRAVIADDRNDENLIIAQLTLLFLKFHNGLVKLLRDNPPRIQECGGDTIFAKARRLATWHYQYLVLHDFLNHVLLGDTREQVFENPKYQPILGFAPEVDTPVNLPVEFSMAAFRFGHSMVRNRYDLNSTSNKHLWELLRRKPQPLKGDEIIDWREFFSLEARNQSLRIDTVLAKALFSLPPDVVKLFTQSSTVGTLVLPARTLIRGSRTRLPSGQQICNELKWDPVEIVRTDFGMNSYYDLLKWHGFVTKTPLWYYLLHEAWVSGSNKAEEIKKRQTGFVLGKLGSRIVAEVFLGVLKADRDSFLFQQPDWKPPTLEIPGHPVLPAITSLMGLVRFVEALDV
jgi:heme peroxidase